MKLQLDTENKTIKIEGDVEFNELLKVLKKLFPNGEWKEYTLKTSTVINNWSNPIVIKEYRDKYYPWYYTNITTNKHDCATNSGKSTFYMKGTTNDSVFNIQY